MKWKASNSKKGQAEHIFSDALPGIMLVILGIIILSIIRGGSSGDLQRSIHEKILSSYTEKQLLEYLETRVSFQGGKKEIWQIISSKDVTIKNPTELNGAFGNYGIFSGDSAVTIISASDAFIPLFENAPWNLVAKYDDLPYTVQVQHYGSDPIGECKALHGIIGNAQVMIPGEKKVTLELTYCKKPCDQRFQLDFHYCEKQ